MFKKYFLLLLNLKTITLLFFLFLLKEIILNLYFFDLANSGYILGDWLINYTDGGFKRRGLCGSFFLLIQDITNIKLQYLVLSTQIIFYLLFLFYFFKIIHEKVISLLFFTLVISPLTFMFYFNDSELMGRKEIILFTIFSYFAYLISKDKLSRKRELFICSFLFISIFCHEVILFYIPYFIITLFIYNRKIELKRYTYYIFASFLPAIIILLFGGNINEGESLSILSERSVHLETPSVFTWPNKFDSISFYKERASIYARYGVSFILGLLHFGLFNIRKRKEDLKLLTLGFLLAFLYSIPLFFLAIDWGRWLHIHFMIMLVIYATRLPDSNTIWEKSKIEINKKHLYTLSLIPVLLIWSLKISTSGFYFKGKEYFIYLLDYL